MFEIKKVKIDTEKSHKVIIKYDKVRPGFVNDEMELSSGDDPHPDFVKAFQDLRKALLVEAEIEKSFTEELVTIKGVTLSHSSEMGTGAVITGTIELFASNAPLCINTPHKLFESEHAPTLHFDTCLDLKILIHETELFIKGKRAQGSLFETIDQEVEMNLS